MCWVVEGGESVDKQHKNLADVLGVGCLSIENWASPATDRVTRTARTRVLSIEVQRSNRGSVEQTPLEPNGADSDEAESLNHCKAMGKVLAEVGVVGEL